MDDQAKETVRVRLWLSTLLAGALQFLSFHFPDHSHGGEWPVLGLVGRSMEAGSTAADSTFTTDSTQVLQTVPPDTTSAADSTVVADSLAFADSLAVVDSTATTSAAPRSGGVRAALANFASDFGYILTSPARIGRDEVLPLLGIAGVTALLYTYDEQINDGFIRSRGDPVYDAAAAAGDAVKSIGLMGITIPVYAVGALAGEIWDIEPLERVSLELIECHLISAAIRNPIKYLVGRDRPKDGHGAYFYHLGGRSFPSGHASTAFEMATIVSDNVDRWPVTVATYGIATLVALERIDAGVHWSSDVWIGSVAGIAMGKAIVGRHDQRRAAHATLVMREGVPMLAMRWKL